MKGQFVRRKTGELYGVFGIWYDRKGYACICVAGKDVKLHRYIWEQKNGAIPKGYQLHHIDGNKKNYHIENLLLVTQSDHLKIHAGWIKKGDKWVAKPCKDCKQLLPLDSFYPRKGLTPSNRCRKCSATYFKSRNTPRYKAHRKIYMSKYYKKNKIALLFKQRERYYAYSK